MKGIQLQAVLISLCLASLGGAVWAQTPEPQQPMPSVAEPAQPEEPAKPAVEAELLPDLSKRLPMGVLHIDGRSAAIPDWQVVTFDSFPFFPADGQWGEVEWSKGDLLADVLTLGDFQRSLDLHLMTLASMGESLGIPVKLGKKSPIYQIKLSEFRLLERQTIASLVEAVPALLDMPIEKLEVLQDLVSSVEPTLVLKDQTLEELLTEHPEMGSIKLSRAILEDYTVADLPGIEVAPLQVFAQWEDAAISEVPLLPLMSWWLFPQKPLIDGEIAVATVSQSDSAADADDNDALVLTPSSAFEPIEWTAGEEEKTSAPAYGLRERAQINDGQELKGAFPFGPAFKVVPEAITPEGIQMAMYFRTCRSTAGTVDCSAYGIGPIPLQTYRPGETVFLGHYAFPVTPVPPAAPVAVEPAPSEPSSEFFDVVVGAAIEHKDPIGTVVMIFTLLGGVLWWAWRGDPIQFVVLTFRWMMVTQIYRRVTHQLTRKPEPSTVEPPDAGK
jgi:hypothetical protein